MPQQSRHRKLCQIISGLTQRKLLFGNELTFSFFDSPLQFPPPPKNPRPLKSLNVNGERSFAGDYESPALTN